MSGLISESTLKLLYDSSYDSSDDSEYFPETTPCQSETTEQTDDIDSEVSESEICEIVKEIQTF